MSGMMSFLSSNWYLVLIAVVIAYLLGSVNTAVIVTKIFTKGKEDIREMGSGNAGFTNVCVLSVRCPPFSRLCAICSNLL